MVHCILSYFEILSLYSFKFSKSFKCLHLYKEIILFKLCSSSMHIIGLIKLLSIKDVFSILSLITKIFTLIYFKFEQTESIYPIFSVLEKTKLDKSKDVNLLLLKNISFPFK